MIFIDFETDGLNGPISEIAVIDENGKLEIGPPSLDFLSEFVGRGRFIFWHYYMPSYIEKNSPDIFKALKGNFSCFTEIALFVIGKSTIQDITFTLLGRNHEGNAIQDVIDLKECYIKMKGMLKS